MIVFLKVGRGIGTYLTVYQHWNGMLEGCGRALATFLKDVVLVINGIQINPESECKENMIVCNGFCDLVARFIRKHKEDMPGDLYINSAVDSMEFNYYVINTDEGIRIKVEHDTIKAVMSIDQFVDLCGGGICRRTILFLAKSNPSSLSPF